MLQYIFDTQNNLKGGPLSCIGKFTVLNARHWQFDCFEWPSLAVLYVYTSIRAANIFKGVNQYII